MARAVSKATAKATLTTMVAWILATPQEKEKAAAQSGANKYVMYNYAISIEFSSLTLRLRFTFEWPHEPQVHYCFNSGYVYYYLLRL